MRCWVKPLRSRRQWSSLNCILGAMCRAVGGGCGAICLGDDGSSRRRRWDFNAAQSRDTALRTSVRGYVAIFVCGDVWLCVQLLRAMSGPGHIWSTVNPFSKCLAPSPVWWGQSPIALTFQVVILFFLCLLAFPFACNYVVCKHLISFGSNAFHRRKISKRDIQSLVVPSFLVLLIFFLHSSTTHIHRLERDRVLALRKTNI
jgi:hypothetical protein